MAFATVQSWDTTKDNNTEINGNNISENCVFAGLNDAAREIMAQIATARTAGQLTYANYRAVSTADTLVAGDRGGMVRGTAALTLSTTAAATLGAGWWCFVRADGGIVTIDPNSTEQIDGATSIAIPDGQGVIVVCDGSAFFSTGFVDTATFVTLTGTQTLTNKTITTPTLTLKQSSTAAPTAEGDIQWDTDDDLLAIGDGSGTVKIGTSRGDHQIWIPFSAFKPTQTNGAASASGTELATNDIVADGFDFDAATDEKLQFILRLPISWDHTSTIDGVIAWKTAATAGTGNVVWNLAALAIGNDDAMDAALGTAGTVTDSFSVADDYMEAAITGVTPSGTPAASDAIVIQVSRDADNVSDTYTQDARFLGLMLTITTDQELDQ
jgi:hypothetical protein